MVVAIRPQRPFGGHHGLRPPTLLFRGNMHTDTRVIKVAGLKSEVNLDLWGCLEDAKASEATPQLELIYVIAPVDRSL